MLKLKIIAAASILSLVGIILNISHHFSSKAEDDSILQEIAGYKNWTRITKEPLVVAINEAAIQG